MEYTISGGHVIVLAIIVWFVGTYINRKVDFLERYSIPVAVTGGLLCSLIVALIYYGSGIKIIFDTGLRDVLLLVFFSTIGLSAKLRLLREGGKALFVLLLFAVALLVLQNATGVALATLFGAHPGYGLFGGSVSLAGGHGTAIAWGAVAEKAGLVGAADIGIAFATLGLIAGGLIGGPIAERLIDREGLRGTASRAERTTEAPSESVPRIQPSVPATLTTLMLLAICVELGELVNEFLSARGLTIPGFLTAMVVGIVIANGADLFGFEIDRTSRERAGELSLQLFLAMSLMSMQLWVLAGALDKIVIVVFAQMAVITLLSVWLVFRAMGRDYDAAVIVAGFVGLGMGATPVGIANMNAITEKYGPSPKAFLVVPLVGAFFLDVANALVIKTFLSLPVMQAGLP